MRYFLYGLAGLLLSLPVMANGNTCGNLNDYHVQGVTFVDLPVSEAMKQITRDMPYQVIVDGELDASGISATAVGGALGDIMDELGKNTGFTYSLDRCVLRLTAIKKTSIDDWELTAGEPINKQLEEWAQTAGWTFVWRPTKSWIVPADAKFAGSFEDAISRVIEMLHEQGKPVRLKLWEGNHFAEVVDVDAK